MGLINFLIRHAEISQIRVNALLDKRRMKIAKVAHGAKHNQDADEAELQKVEAMRKGVN